MKIESIKNLLDLGGITLEGGRRIAPGRILRSASLDAVSEQEAGELVARFGLFTVIDLRTDLEVSEKPDAAIPGVQYVHIPIFEESVIGITKETGADTGAYIKRTWNRKAIRAALPDMLDIYDSVMRDPSIVSRIAQVLHLIVRNTLEGRTTLFHCSQGKDRTGAVAALLLSFCGLDRESVFDDYERGGRIWRGKALKDAVLLVLFKWDAKAARIAYKANLARREFIRAAYDAIDEEYGSVENLLRDVVGLSDEVRARFLAAVTVPTC